MKKRLLYNPMVLVSIRSIEDYAEELSLSCNREYVDYHNDICPACKNKMKLERHSNTIKNVGTVSVGVYEELGMIIPYTLCKSCAKDVLNPKINVADTLEDYLLETLDLKEKLEVLQNKSR